MAQPSVLSAEIALFSALEKTLHYCIPSELEDAVHVGARVLVPLGRRHASGLVLAKGPIPPHLPPHVQLRPILSVLDPLPLVPADLIELCRWISRYYFYPLGDVFRTALPPGLGDPPRETFRLTEAGESAPACGNTSDILAIFRKKERLSPEEVRSLLSAAPDPARELNAMEAAGLVERLSGIRASRPSPRMFKYLRLVASPDVRETQKNEELRDFISALESAGGILPMRALRPTLKNFDYWVSKLRRKGVLEIEEKEVPRETGYAQTIPDTEPVTLSPDQRSVLAIASPFLTHPVFQPFLLFGATGSGKTEIYLNLTAEALGRGHSVLILAPEIALSSQLEAHFRKRFDSEVAIWHSGLSESARCEQWMQVLQGRKRVVLGVRSSVFMPLHDLGLIIVDEEHDSSYKQDDHLRYHARDVAVMRARMNAIPVILGSATPSLQSFHHSRTDRYKVLSLPNRVMDRPFPSIEVVDMRRESGRYRILSGILQRALAETVENKQQALLFLNRRGFATFYLCNVCGHVLQCRNCSVSLTYHQKDGLLHCHYCGYETAVPERCPLCGHASLVPHGFGTERVQDEVLRLLPEARVVRMDRDTAGRPGGMIECLNAVRHERANVLVGTQMVVKGHDFPNITLVGVVNADTALQIADYRAGETTVQTLMQVAGRAGRGDLPGRVILQTYNPDHYTIGSVVGMDYESFCLSELESRRLLQYPPFSRMLKFLVTASDERFAREACFALAEICRTISIEFGGENHSIALLGPAPAPLARLKGRFRWHIFVKSWTSGSLQRFTEAVLARTHESRELRRAQVAIDRDPTMNL